MAASLPGVLSITPVYRPITRAGDLSPDQPKTGEVTTEGDGVVRADEVRALGHDGSPFLVGAMSDSALSIASSQATGDLPEVVDRYLEFYSYDEGRALLEMIHDLAPGASLAHHSAILSEFSFAEGIRELAMAGAKVICDDVGYASEPFFQDGIIAQAVNDLAASFGVTHDFDVRLYHSSGDEVANGTTRNVSTQQPLEIVDDWGGSGVYEIEIERVAGSGPSLLKYVLWADTEVSTIDEYATGSGTIVGHPAAAGAIAVGAVPRDDPTNIEPYSSWGDATTFFDPAGNRLATPEVRLKPDLVAPDNVSTTLGRFSRFWALPRQPRTWPA